jgi:hypothetical protein
VVKETVARLPIDVSCSARSGKTHLLLNKLAEERKRLLDTQKVPCRMSPCSVQPTLKPHFLLGSLDDAYRRAAGAMYSVLLLSHHVSQTNAYSCVQARHRSEAKLVIVQRKVRLDMD